MTNPTPWQPGRLTDGLDPEQQAVLGDVSTVAERLHYYQAPEPTVAQTQALLDALRPLLVQPPRLGLRVWTALARDQARLLDPDFWWTGAVVFLLGLGVALLDRGGAVTLVLALVAPVLAAGAVAYAFRPAVWGLWELERTLPVHPLELLYVRLGVVIAGNLVMALLLVGMIAARNPQMILWRLALLWLGPMLALSGSALYATVRWGPVAGAGGPLVLWASLVLTMVQVPRMPGLTLVELLLHRILPTASRSDSVLVGAVLALLLGLWLIRQAGRRALGEALPWN